MADNKTSTEPRHITVANNLIAQLEQGTVSWLKPWEPGEPGKHLPSNPVSGKRYSGINVLQLMSRSLDKGYEDNRWMTYNQASSQGWQVRKGEKGTPVQYWKFSEEVDKTDEKGEVVRNNKGEIEKEVLMLDRPKVFWATVFNAEQIDGIPERQRNEPAWDRIERAEAIVEASGMKVLHDQSDRAFYRVSTDQVHMPGREQFPSADKYYSTKLHEMGHWTGHPSRLDRPVGQNPFGSEEYAKEELRAEIASMMIGDDLGIGYDPGQHAAYVGSWIKVLKEDPMELYRAAADAEKITKFVLAFEQQQQQEQGQDKAQELGGGVTPEARYEELLKQGGRLVDRLVESQLMGPEDAMLTDARRDLLSFSAVPESDREVFRQASERALGVELPADWNGHVELEAMHDGASWTTRSPSSSPNEYAIWVGSGSDGSLQQVAVVSNLEDAFALSDRLLLIDAYSQHAASNPQQLDGERKGLEDRQVECRLKLHSSTALDFSNPGESWKNLRETAVSVGLKASIELGGDGPNEPEFRIRYADSSGSLTPITTELNADGKAVTLVDGQRLGRKGLTEDLAWQREGLAEARQSLVVKQMKQEAKVSPKEPATEKTFIAVPFKEKNEAKTLGARWDSKETSWYVPQGEDLALFAKWRKTPEPDKGSELEPGQTVPANPPVQPNPAEKTYLAVPYGEREQASALGARWDKVAKSWFIGQGDDPEKFKRWDPQHIAQLPKMSVQEEFKDACTAAGLKIDGEPIMDGRRYRVKLLDDKPGEKNGVYIGHLDGHPAGYMKNFRTGIAMNWKSKGHSLTEEERAKLHAEAAEKLQTREVERAATYEGIAQKVQDSVERLVAPVSPTVYQQNKGIGPQEGLLTDQGGKRTYIPAQDVSGKLWTMQYIRDDGSKRFPKDSKKEGCFHVVGGMAALAKAPILAIGEGYATMATAAESLGIATVTAFDSGNLKQVAEALHKKYPNKPILFVGDDDVHSAEKSPFKINAGRSKAESAAKEMNASVVFPVFAPGELQAGLSDFNDLATRSTLGRSAAERQLKAAMTRCLENAKDLKQQQTRNRQHEQALGFSR